MPLDAVEVLAELRGHLLVLEERLAKYDRTLLCLCFYGHKTHV